MDPVTRPEFEMLCKYINSSLETIKEQQEQILHRLDHKDEEVEKVKKIAWMGVGMASVIAFLGGILTPVLLALL